MSKTISYNGTAESHPTSYDSSYSAYSASGLTNGQTDSDSTTYSTINLSRGSGAETSVYYNFDLNIPSAATITSVTCTAKCYISTTNSSRVSTRQVRLYSGSTAKGSAATVSNSTTAFSVTAGTWTAAELNNAKIRIYAVRGSSNTTTNYYFRFYGATINVAYTVNSVVYEVTASSNVEGVTIEPATQDVMPGDSASVIVSDVSDVMVTDNGTDVTSSCVTAQGTQSAMAASQTHSGLDGGSSYADYAVGYSAENPNSQNGNMYAASGSTGYVDYTFDFSDIPSGATISSVEVKAYGKRENSTTDSTHMAKIGLYSGSTLKSTEQQFTSTSMQLITISSPGTWTRAELQSAKLRFTVAYYGGAISGITWKVTYSIQGYQYTLLNVQADHVILVQSLGNIIYVKVGGTWVQGKNVLVKRNGSWVSVDKVYKKSGNSWSEQDKSAMFDENKTYKKGFTYELGNCVMNFDGIDSYAARFQNTTTGFEGDWVYPNGISGNFMREVDVVADGKSFTFNGTTSYVRPNASAAFDAFLYSSHTIEAYFELTTFDLTDGNAFTLYVGRNSKASVAIYAYYYGGSIYFIKSSATNSKQLVVPSLSLNVKHYIAANANGWMLDGVYYPDSESEADSSSVATNDVLNVSGQYACASIGMRFKDGKEPQAFNGILYAMRIHNTKLSEMEMRNNMNCDVVRFK